MFFCALEVSVIRFSNPFPHISTPTAREGQHLSRQERNKNESWEYTLVLEHLPWICEALDSSLALGRMGVGLLFFFQFLEMCLVMEEYFLK